jgi:hypothetical protein
MLMHYVGATWDDPSTLRSLSMSHARAQSHLTVCLFFGVTCMSPHVQLHHATVRPSDDAVISEISQLRPDSMSWSNVPDYMVPKVRMPYVQSPHLFALHALSMEKCEFVRSQQRGS